MSDVVLGIIGGSGLYHMPQLQDVESITVETPFGSPSSPITMGRLGDRQVAFLARHGPGHVLLPSEVPYRANIYAFKLLGVQRILSVSAVGSLREEFAPLDVVIPDQLFDRTKNRDSTFFGQGLVAHTAIAEPFCPAVRASLLDAANKSPAKVHDGSTLVVIEGPQFSTIAESEAYRSWGFGIIGMTALPEAKLAREAEMCYATAAMVTDYDVWHQTHDPVTSEMVTHNIQRNTAVAHTIIERLVERVDGGGPCGCQDALATALVTDLTLAPMETKVRLEAILAKYTIDGRG